VLGGRTNRPKFCCQVLIVFRHGLFFLITMWAPKNFWSPWAWFACDFVCESAIALRCVCSLEPERASKLSPLWLLNRNLTWTVSCMWPIHLWKETILQNSWRNAVAMQKSGWTKSSDTKATRRSLQDAAQRSYHNYSSWKEIEFVILFN